MRSLVKDIIQELRNDPYGTAVESILNMLTVLGLLAILLGLFMLSPGAEASGYPPGCGSGLTVSPCWPESQVPSSVPIPGTAILVAVGGWLLLNMRK